MAMVNTGNTVKVQKMNKVLEVKAGLKDLYLKKGWNVIDETGKITEYSNTSEKEKLIALTKELETVKAELEAVKASEPTDVKTLKATIKALTEENNALKASKPE